MLVYQRYITKSIVLPLMTVAFSTTALVWITQILKLLYLFDKGITVTDFFGLIILILPFLLFILLPIITVIAVIYTYNELNSGQQIIVLQGAGLSNLQLTKPALYIALISMLFTYYLSSVLLPLSYTQLKSNLSLIRNNYISGIIEEGTFNQISKEITVYTNRKLPNNTMESIVIFDNRNQNKQAILFAKSGIFKTYDDELIFQLYHGIRQEYDKNGNLTKLLFDTLTIKLVNNNSDTTDNTVYNRDINEYYINELLNPNTELPQQKKIKLIAEGHQRLLWPLYNFVLPFLSLSIFLTHPYNKKSPIKPILSVAFAVLVITALHFIFQNFAYKNLNFIFICYANIFISIMIALYLYLRRTIYYSKNIYEKDKIYR